MKLSRKFWLILVLVICIIAFVSVYVVYSRQASQQEDLKDKLTQDNASFTLQSLLLNSLESQLLQRNSALTAALADLSVSKARFPQSVESIVNDGRLFGIADDRNFNGCKLEITSLTVSEPRPETVGKVITYQVTTFGVVVRAAGLPPDTAAAFETYIDNTVQNILDFVHTIATSEDFSNATIELVSMENLAPPSSDAEVASAEKPGATISLVIYGYLGE